MKIVVTTPTGNVGSRVTRLLLQAGERPTLMLRDPARLDPAIARLADPVQGDQLVQEDVIRATDGADALYWVDPATDGGDVTAGYRQAGANAARAVREHGIERVIFQSSVGAERRSGAGEIDGLAATELELDATDASVTHLRCGFFFTNLLLDPGVKEGVLRVTFPIDRPMPWVDPRDVGDVAGARLLSTTWSGRHVIAVHGPVDLSYRQVAEILADVTGRETRAKRIDDEELRAGLREAGLSDADVEGVAGMSAGLRDGFEAEDPRTLLTTTPTTLASWAAANLAAHS